ncbi:fructose-bisphosphatase class II family protein [Moorena producens]|nr:fructose-bisphosphatase class II family protein [Moorena producens]
MPTSTERKAQQAQQARLLFEQEQQRSQWLAERLRAMGIDPEVTE